MQLMTTRPGMRALWAVALPGALLLGLLQACGEGGRTLENGARGQSPASDADSPPLVDMPRADGVARAGAAIVDASWHFGASAGQFSATGVGLEGGRGFDPYAHAVRKVGSDILGSKISTRALVVEGANGKRVAIVANDLYLPNDLLRRRLAQLLNREPELGISIDNLAMTVSHSHTSPFYSTPAIGPWIFQDVIDIRFYDYMAQRMAEAVREAAAALRPVRMGGAAFYANDIRAHTYGPKISPDGTPAGQPHDYTTRQAYVLRFDDADTGTNLINWVTLGVHPEWVWGEEIMNGDVTHAVMRMLDRETGAITIMSQSETGTSGPHKDERAHRGETRREFQESNLAGADRAARLFADNVHAALDGIAGNQPWDATQFAASVGGFDVDFAHARYAPPGSRPYPGVSNCNLDNLYYDLNPGIPIIGFPDCQFPLGEFVEPFAALGPVSPQALLGTLTDQLLGMGVPLPTSLSGPALLVLEEQDVVPIQAFKMGDVAMTFCPCEQFTDTALNIISRLNRVEGDIHTGWDWDQGYPDDLRRPQTLDNSQDHGCWQSAEDEWSCPHPNQFNDGMLTMSAAAFTRMKAQIHNDAAGWEEPSYLLQAESEPVDPAQIKGNFTHEEHTDFGYGLVIPVGMANDYWGYMPAYREYRAHDHYRKALAGLGPHGADYLATRLSRHAASLNGHPGHTPTVLDQILTVEDTRAEVTALALGELAAAVTPVYESLLPNDGGTPQITQQPPAAINRFAAASVHWIGGSSYEGFPDVVVERETADGWVLAGTMEGEIQLQLTFPGANVLFEPDGEISIPAVPDLVQWASGNFEWEWRANFEAFASELPLPEPGAQGRPQTPYITPAGRYRFRISGRHRGEGEYAFTSDVFEVRNAVAITAENLTLDGATLQFDLGPVNSYDTFADGASNNRNETTTETPAVFGPIDYPDSYESTITWIREERNLHRYASGAAEQVYCHDCSFRPWLNVGEPAEICASVVRADAVVERSCTAQSLGDGRWAVRFAQAPMAGDRVGVLPGDITDALGQVNAAAFLLGEPAIVQAGR
ncbi:MAG: hypothetical protein ABF296_00465 [Oceanococcaceae bacterium]